MKVSWHHRLHPSLEIIEFRTYISFFPLFHWTTENEWAWAYGKRKRQRIVALWLVCDDWSKSIQKRFKSSALLFWLFGQRFWLFVFQTVCSFVFIYFFFFIYLRISVLTLWINPTPEDVQKPESKSNTGHSSIQCWKISRMSFFFSFLKIIRFTAK